MLLKGQCHEIFCFWFFYESVSPQPQSVPLGPFRIFSKIRGDIRKSRCTTGVNDTGGKFATGVNDTGGKLPLVSTTPNLPPVSTTPAAKFATSFPCAVDTGGHRCQRYRRQICRRCQRRRWPPVSMTPAANLPPVSLTPWANN